MTVPLDLDLVLVPADGSEESVAAVEYGVAIAAEYDAAVHVVYVLPQELVRAIELDAADENDLAAEEDAFTEVAAEIAERRGVELSNSTAYGFSTSTKLHHPGSVILDTADDLDADFIVVPRESTSDGPAEVLEKAAEYVLLYASQPVMSV
jgi:nucleotide-binding universal stress UspA family protein